MSIPEGQIRKRVRSIRELALSDVLTGVLVLTYVIVALHRHDAIPLAWPWRAHPWVGTVIVLAAAEVALAWAILTLDRCALRFSLTARRGDAITIVDGPSNGALPLLDRFLERAILFRCDASGYYNGVSGNLRVLSATVTTLWTGVVLVLVAATFQLLQLMGDGTHKAIPKIVATVLLTTWSVIFWRERSGLYATWGYLAKLYNRYVETPPSEGKAELDVRKVLAAPLALDILDRHCRAHRSFACTFRWVLREATARAAGLIHPGDNPEAQKWFTDAWNSIETYGLYRGQARALLSIHQWALLPEADYLPYTKKTKLHEYAHALFEKNGIKDLDRSPVA